MEWIAPIVAIAAALIAGWQAWEARRSRLDARKSAGEAQQHEERAAAASERIASAIEERNAAERAERERYRDPWTMTRQPDAHTNTYRFTLGGDETVTAVRVTTDDVRLFSDEDPMGESLQVVQPRGGAMRPGQSMIVTWSPHGGSPPQISVELEWVRPSGEKHTAATTLD